MSRDRSLLLTSISFDLTQKNLFAALSVGGQLHLAPSGPLRSGGDRRCHRGL